MLKFKLFISLALAVCLFLGAGGFCFALGDAPSVSARSYCLMDRASGNVICEGNSSAKLPMASTTKIMTALCVIRYYDVDKLICVPDQAVGVEGSSVYLAKGERLSVKELLYALMLESANDAAVTLAVGLSGSIEAFAEKMNALAAEIGMADTCFKNPHGLSCDGHYSTARDMALLMCEAMAEPLFCEISSTKSARISAPDSQSYRHLSNHNRLLSKYEYCNGGKTGFTKAAGRCLVSTAKKNTAELVCVTLGAPDDWNDHISLFEYGFEAFSSVELCHEGELKYDLSVVGGVESSVSVTNRKGLKLELLSAENISSVVELPRFVYAPVSSYSDEDANTPLSVGRVVYYQNGKEIGALELFVCDSVERYIPPQFGKEYLCFLDLNSKGTNIWKI